MAISDFFSQFSTLAKTPVALGCNMAPGSFIWGMSDGRKLDDLACFGRWKTGAAGAKKAERKTDLRDTVCFGEEWKRVASGRKVPPKDLTRRSFIEEYSIIFRVAEDGTQLRRMLEKFGTKHKFSMRSIQRPFERAESSLCCLL